jgi:hypothetical protein
LCDGGDKGLDCFLHILFMVLSVNSRDLFALLSFCMVLATNVPVPLY